MTRGAEERYHVYLIYYCFSLIWQVDADHCGDVFAANWLGFMLDQFSASAGHRCISPRSLCQVLPFARHC